MDRTNLAITKKAQKVYKLYVYLPWTVLGQNKGFFEFIKGFLHPSVRMFPHEFLGLSFGLDAIIKDSKRIPIARFVISDPDFRAFAFIGVVNVTIVKMVQ